MSTAASTPEDVAVGRKVALAHWQVGEWSNGRYADYIESTGGVSAVEANLVGRLRSHPRG
jgi:hypothetical protein